jgi:hypothetical protein
MDSVGVCYLPLNSAQQLLRPSLEFQKLAFYDAYESAKKLNLEKMRVKHNLNQRQLDSIMFQLNEKY